MEDAQKIQKDLQQKLNDLTNEQDFKEYYKKTREIFRVFLGSFKVVEDLLKPDPVLNYKLLLESFGAKAELDKKNNKIDEKKYEVIKKFSDESKANFENKDFEKCSNQLFYVLLGNVLEHVDKADMDMKKFNIEKDLYPDLKPPLSLVFFLFQNVTFGPISKKINGLSREYLEKYCALFLGLWRVVFDVMFYEKKKKADKERVDMDNADGKGDKGIRQQE